RPFEGAVNRTSAIVVEKVCELRNISQGCPDSAELVNGNRIITHVIWVSEKAVSTNMPLEEVLKTVKRYRVMMTPIIERDPSSPWMQVTEKVLPHTRKFINEQYKYRPYEAHEGVNTALNQVYFVKINGKREDGKLVITNPPESGQKREVKQVEAVVEEDLIHPLIRGKDVKKWYADCIDRYIILPHNPRTGEPLTKTELQQSYPGVYGYLYQFREDLMSRSIKPFLSLRNVIKKSKSESERQRALNKLEETFYIVDNIGPYTFAPYKVVWKEVSARMMAGGFHTAVVEPVHDGYLGTKVVVPEHTVVLVPLNSLDEAHYLSAVLNSSILTFIGTYMPVKGLENLNIPKFNPSNPVHVELASLSKRAHELAKCIYTGRHDLEEELRNVEEEIDKSVVKLYDVPEDTLEDIKKLLAILMAEEEEGEEE
ncbi:MAG: class I SAM-dependent DNA methyltransferase, partial [Candidatus Korarchaeum sp.]